MTLADIMANPSRHESWQMHKRWTSQDIVVLEEVTTDRKISSKNIFNLSCNAISVETLARLNTREVKKLATVARAVAMSEEKKWKKAIRLWLWFYLAHNFSRRSDSSVLKLSVPSRSTSSTPC